MLTSTLASNEAFMKQSKTTCQRVFITGMFTIEANSTQVQLQALMVLPIGTYLLFTMFASCFGSTQYFWGFIVVFDH